MNLVNQCALLLGLESVEALASRLAATLRVDVPPGQEAAYHLLLALARREQFVDASTEDLTGATALEALAVIDERVAVMRMLARDCDVTVSASLDHTTFVRRLYEDSRFGGKEPKGDMPALVLAIAQRCEPGVTEDDLDVFLVDGLPTLFFYETVRAHAEAVADRVSGVDAEEDEEDDEGGRDDEEGGDQPVRAYIKPFSVRTLIEMVEEGELDVYPAWQRTDVWSLKKKRELVRSLILGIPLPSIILHKRGRSMSIIDGKQRLLSIVQFAGNEYKLPRYDVPATSPLYPCRASYYDRADKQSLPSEVRKDLRLREIPALVFEDVPESRLRSIFHLYNVAGMKLNAAEIRNAVYQANPIHRALYILAGEGDGRTDIGVGGAAVQEAFKADLRRTYPGAHRRYQGVDFLARYLGYSRAAQSDGARPFAPPSTSRAIDNYFDYRSEKEDASTVAKEVIRVFNAAPRFFDVDDEHLAFFTRGTDGKRKFSKLAATTHMVATGFLLDMIAQGAIQAESAMAVIREAPAEVPEKQQSATIWDFQARVLLRLRESLGLASDKVLGERWAPFFRRMEYCVLPTMGGE